MKQVIVPALVALVALASCSSSDGSTTPSSVSTSADGLDASEATASTLAPAGAGELGVSVNGAALTVAEFEAQLEAWADIAETAGDVVREGDGYAPGFVAAITDQYIRFQAFLATLDTDGIEITDDDRAAAETAAETDFPGLAVEDPARILAVSWYAGLAAIDPSPDELDAYVADNTEILAAETICSSHILVETQSEADDVVARLADGEAFADVAAEVSIDTGSGATGGDLGCVGLGAFVPEFEAAALAAEVGVVTDPVESQFGFHMIVTRESTVDDLLPIASAKISADNASRVADAANTATVELAPQFGTWDQATHVYTPPPD